MWPFKRKRREPFKHETVAEILRTTTRCRATVYWERGLDGDTLYDAVWLKYCCRRPFTQFATTTEAIEWVAAALMCEEDAELLRETEAAHG